MDLIDDNDFTSHAQMAQHQVSLLQRDQQQLIYCANDKISQQRLLVALKPRVHIDPLFGNIFLDQRPSTKKFPLLHV